MNGKRAVTCFPVFVLACVVASCSTRTAMNADPADMGWVNRSILATPPYTSFKTTYDTCRVDTNLIGLIRQASGGLETIIFFGRWCSDSQREVPRYLKIADLAGIPQESVKLYGLDRSKRSTDGLTTRYRIELVPTFILLKDGAEIGRIVESPRTTMEGDLLQILALHAG